MLVVSQSAISSAMSEATGRRNALRPARSWSNILVTTLLLCVATNASAQLVEDEAETAFREGVAAIQSYRYADAVPLLTRALELRPGVATAFNLAFARRAIGEALEARSLLRDLLGERYGEPNVETRLRVDELLAESERDVAVLTIDVEQPETARVSVDGEPRGVARVGSPLEVEVNPGERALALSAVDFEPYERTFAITPGERRTVSASLRPFADARPGTLVVDSTDREASIEVLGHERAIGRLQLDLAAGEYTIVLTGDHGSRESVVDVIAGRTVRLELTPPARQRRPWVWVGIIVGSAALIGAGIWIGVSQFEPAPVIQDWNISI